MKTLLLMRHAKALQPEPGENDFDRNLSERGKNDAREMGERIGKTAYMPQLILASPAKRTYKTAKLVAESLKMNPGKIVPESMLYNAGIDDITHAIREIDNAYKIVLIVGHNPAFTSIAGYLTPSFIEHVPTSGYYIIRFATDNWKMIHKKSGELVHFDYPKA